jgi:subtilisin-like proprotein convertase family protein
MKKIITICLLLSLITSERLLSQIVYSEEVADLVEQIQKENLEQLVKEFSGYIPTTIEGEAYTFQTRHAFTDGNIKAAQWLYERFESYGYEPHFMDYTGSGRNVIATQYGSQFPEKEYIICGHYDNMPMGASAPGADDNASGTCAVLEAAKLMFDRTPLYTIRYICFDEEELGLYGSNAYVDSVIAYNQNVLGVINLDMIAYDSDNNNKLTIATNELSSYWTDQYVNSMGLYVPELSANFNGSTYSDHSPFWNEGIPAILAIEDNNDFHPHYHTVDDTFDYMNMDYYEKMTKAAVAALASYAWGYHIEIDHQEILSSSDQSDREAIFTINNLQNIGTGIAAPLLYYSLNESLVFETIEATNVTDNEYTFYIPGQTFGTDINYYLGFQNEDGTISETYPNGGSGINPPGSIAPTVTFSYSVDLFVNNEFNSGSVSIPINDYEFTTDTIIVEDAGELVDVDVNISLNHSNDADLMIILEDPSGHPVLLSDGNGGEGDNYINTTFDDEAEILISNGVAPFTGTFIPQTPLYSFDGTEVQGKWVIKIYDKTAENSGELVDWNLMLYYLKNVTNINTNERQLTHLKQNFPNPCVNSTTIEFSLENNEYIEIDLYDLQGRTVKTIAKGKYAEGNHTIKVNLNNIKPGQYFYRLKSDSMSETRKMIIGK